MREERQKNRDCGTIREGEVPAGRPTGEAVAEPRVLGRLVRSRAGHDQGALLVIVGIEDDNHVLVADGKTRRMEKPKRKKLRHIEVTDMVSEELGQKLARRCTVQDAELSRFIASCRAALDGAAER